MIVDQQRPAVVSFRRMAGEMDFADNSGIDRVDIGFHVESDIGRGHLDIVNVKEQAAARFFA